VWWNGATNKEVRTSINLQDGTTVELHGDPYTIVLSGSNAVSCLLNEQLVHPVNKVRFSSHRGAVSQLTMLLAMLWGAGSTGVH
jgi:hypothetical protein